jgi:hypothetical protein
MPKFAVFVMASPESEAGRMATAEELIEMKAFNDELRKIGALHVAEGLLASSRGARIQFTPDGPSKPESGPFDLENLVTGFWVWELESLEQAVAWANKIPFKKGKVEIRCIAGKEDFPADYQQKLNEGEGI